MCVNHPYPIPITLYPHLPHRYPQARDAVDAYCEGGGVVRIHNSTAVSGAAGFLIGLTLLTALHLNLLALRNVLHCLVDGHSS